MHGKRTEIPAILFAPDREDCLRAVSLALLKVRSLPGVSCEKLAKALDCSADTIRAASNEQNMLSFDHIATLCHHFPDECTPIKEVLFGDTSKRPTVADRFQRIEAELAAIQRETAQ